MKKIFTLLLSVGLVTMAFAQSPDNQRRYESANNTAYNDNRRNNDHFNNNYSFRKKQMEMKIADINRDYDRKIESIKCNWFMSRYKKQRLINELEGKRREEIRCVYSTFNDRRNDYDDHGPKRGW